MAQRLATTAGAPAAKNARASDDAPSVAEMRPPDVLQPESTTSAVWSRCQLAMSRRIDTVEASAEHRQGVSVHIQRTLVRGTVDAQRQPAGDDEPSTGQFGREGARVL